MGLSWQQADESECMSSGGEFLLLTLYKIKEERASIQLSFKRE